MIVDKKSIERGNEKREALVCGSSLRYFKPELNSVVVASNSYLGIEVVLH